MAVGLRRSNNRRQDATGTASCVLANLRPIIGYGQILILSRLFRFWPRIVLLEKREVE